jgi:hypothetical protein
MLLMSDYFLRRNLLDIPAFTATEGKLMFGKVHMFGDIGNPDMPAFGA